MAKSALYKIIAFSFILVKILTLQVDAVINLLGHTQIVEHGIVFPDRKSQTKAAAV